MRVTLPTQEELGFPPLYVMPENHPQQLLLAESQRDVAVARAHGAEWVPNRMVMRPTRPESDDSTKFLLRRFGTKSAKARAEQAWSEMPHRVSREEMARAANRELESRGVAPVREIPERIPEPAERTYFYTAREPDSPFHYKRLDERAREAGIALMIDRDRASPHWGLRYVEGPAPAVLAEFRTPEAEAAHRESKARRDREMKLVAAAATTAAVTEQPRVLRPLTVPLPDRDRDGFIRARNAIRSIGTARLLELLEVTRKARDELKLEEDRLVVTGQELTPQQKSYYGHLHRGIRLAEQILRERGALDRADSDAPSGRRPAAAGRSSYRSGGEER